MKTIKICVSWLFGHFIIYVPLIVLTILGAGYIYLLISSPISTEQLQFLISLDAAIATLSGLSLYASYASRDEIRKNSYFACGEQLFHAFILMFIATFMRGGILLLDDFSWYDLWRIPIQIVFVSTTIIFFLYGLWHLILGLKNLIWFIHKITTKKS